MTAGEGRRAPRKALITGGAGFIGSHLAELLLDDGWEIWALDDLSTGSLDNVEQLRDRPEFHLVVDSVLSRTVVNELVNKVEVVYHLAAAVGPRLIVEQPVHTIVTNLEGSEIVLDHCARFGRRVLVASTSEVYGDHRSAEPLHEDARRVYGPTTQKRWLYADSKAMDEYLALAYRQERDLDFVVARLFNTVGPRQSGQYGMVVARFVQAAVTGTPLEIHGDGSQTRTFCHVQDTIRALKGLMESSATTGEIYNVGSRNWISIGELAAKVLEVTESRSEVVYVPYERVYGTGIDDMLHRVPAIDKIAAAIGWAPERDLDTILSDVVAYYRGQARTAA
ncbi:MAG TPA: NAD-dependent epimerase/dehydratase family protein [Gaiellaceae bacterium]|nr:NAD-dependent epimerase/dehydratase family protein [Gaiellaceae bacterium]